ncbi:MAG TPA: helicase-related protein, partial [Candidatus Glassbacteria bacterium]|nr:helicase-related protein [Candidatus Glassbacteria bacterium]
LEPVLLVGKLSPAEKRRAAELIESGRAEIAVGTHALIQEGVAFRDLGLVVVDEQHRFGVNQRLALQDKGRHTDSLVMTATPIPRSLALTLYGDLDVSVIDELPAGRKPVSTHIVPERKRARMQKFIGERLAAGEQAYVVCPRIEETDESERASAEAWYARYRDEIFPREKVVMLHGRLASADKEAAMGAFEAGEARVLVGTTVIEVGIDVPAATVIVIENAERFGLSQLHQLRGRVGRSDRQSWCLLVPSPDAGADSLARLKILASTNDGFKISEEDLRLRGPGDFFGERQSGLPELRASDIVADYPVLVEARREAEKILRDDPWLAKPENREMRKELILRYRDRVGFLRAG